MAVLPANAENNSFDINLKKAGVPIQSTMYGIFFEDINYAADGGLYAELNEGFFGIGIKRGETYNFSVWARADRPVTLRVELVNTASMGENHYVCQQRLTVNSQEWKQYKINLRPNQTLEKANSSKKKVKGTGTPENGAYSYELIHTDDRGKQKVIFSNGKVGGEETPNDMQGLEQATNALSDWFYLASLEEGESGRVTLNIAFDGETEVNDYMDTDGSVELAFAVDKPETVTKPTSAHTTPGKKAVKSGPRTGDMTQLIPYIVLMLTGIILLIAVLRRKGGEADENDQ